MLGTSLARSSNVPLGAIAAATADASPPGCHLSRLWRTLLKSAKESHVSDLSRPVNRPKLWRSGRGWQGPKMKCAAPCQWHACVLAFNHRVTEERWLSAAIGECDLHNGDVTVGAVVRPAR